MIPGEEAVRAAYEKITKTLIAEGLTITTMESCTAGFLSSLITDTEGASAVLPGAFVTYSNEAKIRAGVPREVIEKYTVYSKETASAMAAACRRAFGTDIGVGITGSFGNVDPANPDASVPGEVYFAIETKDASGTFFRKLPLGVSRHESKVSAADAVARELLNVVTGRTAEEV
ncbi:MAG: CinA family protein [Lachnospiraceae bacterium]|nr:CinA family protein [Lachnospiraceae bacterium]